MQQDLGPLPLSSSVRKHDPKKYGEQLLLKLTELSMEVGEVRRYQREILQNLFARSGDQESVEELRRDIGELKLKIGSQHRSELEGLRQDIADLTNELKTNIVTSKPNAPTVTKQDIADLNAVVMSCFKSSRTQLSDVNNAVKADLGLIRKALKQDIERAGDELVELFSPALARMGYCDDGEVPTAALPNKPNPSEESQPDQTSTDQNPRGVKIKFQLTNPQVSSKPIARSELPQVAPLGEGLTRGTNPGRAGFTGFEQALSIIRREHAHHGESVQGSSGVKFSLGDTDIPSPTMPTSSAEVGTREWSPATPFDAGSAMQTVQTDTSKLGVQSRQEKTITADTYSWNTGLGLSDPGLHGHAKSNSEGRTASKTTGKLMSSQSKQPKNRSSFSSRGANEDLGELQEVFLKAEEVEAREGPESKTLRGRLELCLSEGAVDFISCAIILLNSAWIGATIDVGPDRERAVRYVNTFFGFLFTMELALRIRMRGVAVHFRGPNRRMNGFETLIIGLDLVFIGIGWAGLVGRDTPSVSLLRIVRFARLLHLLRLLNNPTFETPLMICQGFLGGLATLFWAVMILALLLYMGALILRESLGRSSDETIKEMFKTVPRSFLTSYRCTFGDCSTDGDSIYEQLYNAQGAAYYALPVVCLASFGMMVGALNVISAIFVEETLHSASQVRTSKFQKRLKDMDLWTTRIAILTRKLVAYSGQGMDCAFLSQNVIAIYGMEVPCHIVDELAKDIEVRQALTDLDIDPNDFEHLSDIIDPDNGGSLYVIEFIDGLRRLRGQPRRSDIVKCDLMIRSVQQTLYQVQNTVQFLREDSKHVGRLLKESDARREMKTLGDMSSVDVQQTLYRLQNTVQQMREDNQRAVRMLTESISASSNPSAERDPYFTV